MNRSQIFATLFFGGALLCILNPEPLPARDWFNQCLNCIFGWMQ